MARRGCSHLRLFEIAAPGVDILIGGLGLVVEVAELSFAATDLEIFSGRDCGQSQPNALILTKQSARDQPRHKHNDDPIRFQ